ncbi:MAG: penicillin-binding transpeptidase domain-containing protein, partial [Bdellovibrionales bacterium]
MSSWRGHRRSSINNAQPFLPGLFSPKPTPAPSKKKPSSPGDRALCCAQTRLPLVFLAFLLCFLTIAGRLSFLTLGNSHNQATPIKAASGYTPVTARADIVDRHGTILATSLPTVLLMANTRHILDAKEAAAKLAQVLPNLEQDKLYQRLQTPNRYIILQRHLTPRQYYEVNKLGVAGLEFMPDESRIYPAGPLTAHVIGYTDIDNIGIAGLEKTLNQELQEKPYPISSSLDLRLQTILQRELSLAINEFKAAGAAGLIMDIETGEILSLVSLPDFDPQDVGHASNDALFNKATLGVYEMGSTFKLFNTALALN